MSYLVKVGYSTYYIQKEEDAISAVKAISRLSTVKTEYVNGELHYGTDHEGVEVGLVSINGIESVAELKRLKEKAEQDKIEAELAKKAAELEVATSS